MEVWKKEEIPEDLHYSNNDRITDIFLSADNRWDILMSKKEWEKVCLLGTFSMVKRVSFSFIWRVSMDGDRMRKICILSSLPVAQILPTVPRSWLHSVISICIH